VAGLVTALVFPGTAWAPRVKGLPGYVGPCEMEVEGVPSDGVFVGDIFVLGYEARGEDLLANISVTGSCRVGESAQGLNDAQVVSPVTVEKSNCQKLQLRLGTVEVRDITLDLSGATMDSTAEKDDRVLLCAIAKSLKQGNLETSASLLNLYFQ
jgi:hypothetical protein